MEKINYNAEQVKSVFDQNPAEDAIIITSDGNVFLTKHKSYAKNHCNEFKKEFETLTRAQFETESTGGKSKTSSPAAAPGLSSAPAGDWKDGKFGEIVDFAKSKGLEAKTRTNQGKKVLIVEVETFLATLPPVKEEKAPETPEDKKVEDPLAEADDYKVVGAAGTESSQE